MTVNRGDAATAAARDLADGLKTLRQRSGLTTRALAERVDASAANVSHWERGSRLPSEERLGALLEALDASADEHERLLGLRRQADGPGQLVAGTPVGDDPMTEYVEREQLARNITEAAPLLMPGLLQTREYARILLREHRDIETRIVTRMGRRDVLTRQRGPAEFVTYIDTEVLMRPVVPGPIMAEQLRFMLQMGQLPNVTLRLVSSTTPGYTPLLSGGFTILEFASASPIVHVEHLSTSAFLWEAKDVRAHQVAVELLNQIAMTPAESAEVIAGIVNGLETT